MQVFKSVLSQVFISFCVITAFLIIFNGLFALIFNRDSVIYTWHILRYPLVVFVSMLSVFMYVFFEVTTRAGEILRQILQMAITAGLVLGMIILLGGAGWENFLRSAVIFILLSQISVAAGIANERKIANEINKRLKQLHDEDATHEG